MTRRAISGAKLLVGDELVTGKALVIAGRRIEAIVDEGDLTGSMEVRRLEGGILAPGFIDTQVNGGGGVLFNDEPTVETIRKIGAAHRRFGTTGFLPTLITDDAEVVEQAIAAVDQAMAEEVPGVLGIHLEGPFLSPHKNGIHDAAKIVPPSERLLHVMGTLQRGVTLVTLAPEVVDLGAIERLTKANVIVAAGHTNATYERTKAGLAAGIRGFTHLFNVMSPLTSRAPGVVGAALEDLDSWCGLIVDGVHVHPATLRIALRSRPVDRFMLVTDAMPPVGTDATSFVLQGRPINVEGQRCVDSAGTLAGSALDMATAVRNCVELVGLDLASGLGLAAASPADFLRLGATRGRIAPGLAADLVWLDDHLQVQETWIGGAGDRGPRPLQTGAEP